MKHSFLHKTGLACAVLLAIVSGAALLTRAQSAPPQASSPGALADGSTLLPNGWRLAPAGRHLMLGDLPLNLVQSPDSRYSSSPTTVSPSPLSASSMSRTGRSRARCRSNTRGTASRGIPTAPGSTRRRGAEHGAGVRLRRRRADARAHVRAARRSPARASPAGWPSVATARRCTSRASSRRRCRRLICRAARSSRPCSLPAEPYTCVVSADGKLLYVSLWGGARVSGVRRRFADARGRASTPASIRTRWCSRPTASACSSRAATARRVWVYDTVTGQPIEQMSMSLFPDAPRTATPNSLALVAGRQDAARRQRRQQHRRGRRRQQQRAAVSSTASSRPGGTRPARSSARDGKQMFVLSGKGLAPSPNMTNSGMEQRLRGAVSAVPTPDRTALAEHTRKVYALTPYSDAIRLTRPTCPIGSPIPHVVGEQLADQARVLHHPRESHLRLGLRRHAAGQRRSGAHAVRPRHDAERARARGELRAVRQLLRRRRRQLRRPRLLDRRLRHRLHPEDVADATTRTAAGCISAKAAGSCAIPSATSRRRSRATSGTTRGAPTSACEATASSSTTSRSRRPATSWPSRPCPDLQGAVAPAFAAFDLDITDNKRVDIWLREFTAYVQNGNLPQLSIMRLGNDHTNGTAPGVADAARDGRRQRPGARPRGRRPCPTSVYWKDSAIFVLEDDAQSGPDHVDSHRSVALVASPFAKRGVVDHTFYTTSGVLRTMELILGLPPMSKYDAAATPHVQRVPGHAEPRRLSRS